MDPVVPTDMGMQRDELTGKTLELKKVVQGRLRELQKFIPTWRASKITPVLQLIINDTLL
jgi:hypothetical protein